MESRRSLTENEDDIETLWLDGARIKTRVLNTSCGNKRVYPIAGLLVQLSLRCVFQAVFKSIVKFPSYCAPFVPHGTTCERSLLAA
eukprot:9564812-Heterocapsa_arctica.AAC.1